MMNILIMVNTKLREHEEYLNHGQYETEISDSDNSMWKYGKLLIETALPYTNLTSSILMDRFLLSADKEIPCCLGIGTRLLTATKNVPF
jgi:hypothetical protein